MKRFCPSVEGLEFRVLLDAALTLSTPVSYGTPLMADLGTSTAVELVRMKQSGGSDAVDLQAVGEAQLQDQFLVALYTSYGVENPRDFVPELVSPAYRYSFDFGTGVLDIRFQGMPSGLDLLVAPKDGERQRFSIVKGGEFRFTFLVHGTSSVQIDFVAHGKDTLPTVHDKDLSAGIRLRQEPIVIPTDHSSHGTGKLTGLRYDPDGGDDSDDSVEEDEGPADPGSDGSNGTPTDNSSGTGPDPEYIAGDDADIDNSSRPYDLGLEIVDGLDSNPVDPLTDPNFIAQDAAPVANAEEAVQVVLAQQAEAEDGGGFVPNQILVPVSLKEGAQDATLTMTTIPFQLSEKLASREGRGDMSAAALMIGFGWGFLATGRRGKRRGVVSPLQRA